MTKPTKPLDIAICLSANVVSCCACNGEIRLGTVIEAKCRCGFSRRVVMGGTRSGYRDYRAFPHWCAQCGLVSANVALNQATCPNDTNHAVVAYGACDVEKPNWRSGALTWIKSWISAPTHATAQPIVSQQKGHEVVRDFDYWLTRRWHLCPDCGCMSLEFAPTGPMFD